MYRDLKASSAGWVRKKSYCNTVGCIARGGWFKEKFVLQRFKFIAIQMSVGVQNCIAIQFTGQQCIAIHCTILWHETGLPVLQDRRLCRDTALGWGTGRKAGLAGRAGRRRRGAGARRRQARWARRRQVQARVGSGMTWARRGARSTGGRAGTARARGRGGQRTRGSRRGRRAGRAAWALGARPRR